MSKEPAYVTVAREALAAAKAKQAEAEQAKHTASQSYYTAITDLRKAMEQADSALPQCRSVTISRYRSGEQEAARVVILRKTNGGRLVVRKFGDMDSKPAQFEWSRHSQVYRERRKRSDISYGSAWELRDVPADWLPAEEVA